MAIKVRRMFLDWAQVCMLSSALLASCSLFAKETSEQTLRVMTYNIRHGTDLEGKEALAAQTELMKRHNLDLLSLQEVDKGIERSQRVNQPDMIATTLELDMAFASFMALQGGQYGIAAFSKTPFSSTSDIALPAGMWEPRTFINTLTYINGKPVVFVPVHFDWLEDDSARFAQAQALLASLDNKYPVILSGDFNDVPNSRTMALLKASGFEFTVKGSATYVGDEPTEIDFIAVRDGNTQRLRIIQSEVLAHQGLSDHAPVLAVLRLEKK